MKKIIVHLPTEEELARQRMGGKFNRLTLSEVADIISRNRTREKYGVTEGTIQLTFDR